MHASKTHVAHLQIRDIPEGLHALMQARARQHNRSLRQQALHDLEEACSDGCKQSTRDGALERIKQRQRIWKQASDLINSKALIQADRDLRR